MENTTKEPLEVLIAKGGYSEGYEAGRAFESARYENLNKKVKNSRAWRDYYNRLYTSKIENSRRLEGKFGLLIGNIMLNEKFESIQEAVDARDRIYKPHQRSAVVVVQV